jgi:hypothetical protein
MVSSAARSSATRTDPSSRRAASFHFCVLEVPQAVPISIQKTQLEGRAPPAPAPEREPVEGNTESVVLTPSIETASVDPKSLFSSKLPLSEALGSLALYDGFSLSSSIPEALGARLSGFCTERETVIQRDALPRSEWKEHILALFCGKNGFEADELLMRPLLRGDQHDQAE